LQHEKLRKNSHGRTASLRLLTHSKPRRCHRLQVSMQYQTANCSQRPITSGFGRWPPFLKKLNYPPEIAASKRK
jgi:hypothetical protein